jgi:signal transduction histidine kinase
MFRAAALAAALTASLAAPVRASERAPAAAPSPFDAAIDAAKAAMMTNPGVALTHARAGFEIATRDAADAQTPVRLATAQWLEGEALMRLNRPDEARQEIADALAVVAARQPNTNLHGRLTLAHANLADAAGEVQTALGDYQAAYTIFGAAGEPRGQAMALQGVGDVYQEAGDSARAVAYYAQSAEAYKADPALLLSAYNNTGNALRDAGRFDEAIGQFQHALAVAKEMESPLLQVRVLLSLASAEGLAGRLPAANAHLAQGLKLADADPEAREWRPQLWGVGAELAARRGDFAGAGALLNRAFDGVDLTKTGLDQRDFHKLAAEVYERLGDSPLALRHLKAFKRLDDEARGLTSSAAAALMTARFDFATQQSRIARLKAEQLEKDVALARARNATILVLLTGAGAALFLLVLLLLHMRASRNQMRAANAKLSDANLSLERAVKARTEFLATTSHEIRTPLNAILGMTQVILADPKLPAPLREKVSIVHGGGETMRALMDDILDAAKIETGNLVIEPVEIDLHGLLEEARRLWREPAAAKGVALTVDFARAPARIVEDVTRLRQIVFNLMSNAIKFTMDGAVTLSAAVETSDKGEVLVLKVTDTGIGIPDDRLEDIFESFRQVDSSVTRKYGGTGLGLAICRRLAVAMGGELGVASELGRGSVFTVRLPLTRAPAPVKTAPTELRPPAETLASCSVLAVEPNPLAQSLLRAALTSEVRGLEVVSSWPEALGALAGQTFDLILADGSALEDQGGEALAMLPSLVREARGTPVVALWSGDPDDVERLLTGGCAHVVRKPIATGDLVAELRGVCEPATSEVPSLRQAAAG